MIESKSEFLERWDDAEEMGRDRLGFTDTSISGVDGIRHDLFFYLNKEFYSEWELSASERRDAVKIESTSILEVKYWCPENGGPDRSEISKLAGRMLECNARLAIIVASRISDGARTTIKKINKNIRRWGMEIIFIPLSRVERISWFDGALEYLEKRRKRLLELAHIHGNLKV